MARECQLACNFKSSHVSYVDEQIRDVMKEAAHADVRRRCVMNLVARVQDVLEKVASYVKSLELTKFSKGRVYVRLSRWRRCISAK